LSEACHGFGGVGGVDRKGSRESGKETALLITPVVINREIAAANVYCRGLWEGRGGRRRLEEEATEGEQLRR